MPAVAGVKLATAEAGIRYRGRTDVLLAAFDTGTTVAGVFTRSLTAGAPVDWCRAALPRGKARAIVVNSGNSNVFTGRAGRQVVEDTAKTMAKIAGCLPREVFIASTGVIGEPPPLDKIIAGLAPAAAAASPGGWMAAATLFSKVKRVHRPRYPCARRQKLVLERPRYELRSRP